MVRLFIENREVELDKDVQFAITSQFENLSNPTNVINDWSKTVSIPFTQKNNELFGHIYNPDRVTVDGGSTAVGIYFNPLKKLDFRLEWNNAVLISGYAKMNEVKQSNGKGTYEISLFGQLGKVFQEMKKITFNESSTDTDYIIDGSQYVDETIDKQLVWDSWHTSEQRDDVLRKKGETYYSVHDIIGFAPNNSFSEGFDYKTYEYVTGNTTASKTFEETLGDSFETATGIAPSTAIPNGMLPREIGEYRSYYQLPFIYWNKLFSIFQEKAETVTGYQFDMDNSWFTQSNPYWHNLVYMLNPLNNMKNTTYNNIYSSNYTSQHVVYHNSSERYKYTFSEYEPGLSWQTESEQIPILIDSGSYPHYFHLTDKEVTDGQLSVHVRMDIACNLGSQQNVHIRNNAVFLIDVFMTDAAVGHSETYRRRLGRICIKDVNSSYVAGDTTYTVNVGTQSIPSGSYNWTLVDNDFSFTIPSDLYNHDVKISFGVNGYHAEGTFSGTLFVNTNPSSIDLGDITVYATPNTMRLNITPLIGKSFSNFTLNNLWNNDFNLFDEILKYCKMYRIGITVDEYQKKVIFKPVSKYFGTYTVDDWTDKIDKSKDFTITPVTFSNKYVVFNYKDSKTKLGEDYKKKYGLNYGDYRLITDYNFNTDTTNLFKDIVPSIVNTDNVLSWNNLYTYHKIIYSFANEIFVYNKDKDNKQVDVFGSFYFHNGLGVFNDEEALHLRTVYISDDTVFQQKNNTYFYTQISSQNLQIDYYPRLDIVRGKNMCVFNVPKENYTYLNNYSGKHSIYSNLWSDYINERYNLQNKQITCYVDLKPIDYNNFNFNHLVKVGKQLCMVNKIYDYDVTSNTPTKVDLITIQDIGGYTETDYTFDMLSVSPKQLTIPYDYFKEVTVTSNGDWQIKADDWRDFLCAYPEEGTSGSTKVIIGTLDEEWGGSLTFEMYNEDEQDFSTEVTVSVSLGGTPNMKVTPWYNECTVGSSITIQMSASTSWSVYAFDKHGNENRKVLTYPSIASSGTRNLTVSVPFDSATGLVDIYIKDTYSDLITSYRVNIKAPTNAIYTLNSEGTAQQSEDSVEYHGLSSTRGYKVYSTSSWTATLPQGVSSYGATSGDAGVTNVTFNWGSGTPNTSKTITFTNTQGTTCSLVCHYITE